MLMCARLYTKPFKLRISRKLDQNLKFGTSFIFLSEPFNTRARRILEVDLVSLIHFLFWILFSLRRSQNYKYTTVCTPYPSENVDISLACSLSSSHGDGATAADAAMWQTPPTLKDDILWNTLHHGIFSPPPFFPFRPSFIPSFLHGPYPTEHFTISERQNPSTAVSEWHKLDKSMDFESPKLWNDWSGTFLLWLKKLGEKVLQKLPSIQGAIM